MQIIARDIGRHEEKCASKQSKKKSNGNTAASSAATQNAQESAPDEAQARCCSFGNCDCSSFVPSTSSRVRPSHPHLICATCGHGALYHPRSPAAQKALQLRSSIDGITWAKEFKAAAVSASPQKKKTAAAAEKRGKTTTEVAQKVHHGDTPATATFEPLGWPRQVRLGTLIADRENLSRIAQRRPLPRALPALQIGTSAKRRINAHSPSTARKPLPVHGFWANPSSMASRPARSTEARTKGFRAKQQRRSFLAIHGDKHFFHAHRNHRLSTPLFPLIPQTRRPSTAPTNTTLVSDTDAPRSVPRTCQKSNAKTNKRKPKSIKKENKKNGSSRQGAPSSSLTADNAETLLMERLSELDFEGDFSPEDYELLLMLDNNIDKSHTTLQTVDHFERRTGFHGGEDYECRVCLQLVNPAHTCMTLPCCDRTFHAECIENWLVNYKKTCPNCRFVF